MIDQNFHEKVVEAHHRIQNDVRFTPLQYSPALSSQSNADVDAWFDKYWTVIW